MRVLVVDDEREVLERILRVEGFEVAVAEDGREAVRAQAAAPADAVLLDILMPGLDGVEVCRRLRDTGDAIRSRALGLICFHQFAEVDVLPAQRADTARRCERNRKDPGYPLQSGRHYGLVRRTSFTAIPRSR